MAEAINEQMKMAFMDDGMERDPVSGNDIPTGSLAEEVRDDVPAMLSEGEYVVPADVLRFYGIKFFEDLRIKAKDGLARMESMGRIGGEPIEEEEGEPSNVLPFPVEELETEEEEIEMAVGGYVGYDEGGAELPSKTGLPSKEELGYVEIPDWVFRPAPGTVVSQVITPVTNPITGEVFNAPNSGYRAMTKEEMKKYLGIEEEEEKEEDKKEGQEDSSSSESGFRQVQYWNGQDESTIFTATFIGDVPISHSPTQLEKYVQYVPQADDGEEKEEEDSSASKETREERIKRRDKEKFEARFKEQEEKTKKLYPEGFGSKRIARTDDEIFDYAKQLKGFGPMNIGIDDIITKIPGIGNLTSALLAKQHKDILEDAKEIYNDPEAYDNLPDERKIILDNLVAGAEGYTPARSFAHQGLDAFGKLFSPTSSKKLNTGSSSSSDYNEAKRKKRKDKKYQDRIKKDTSGKLKAQDNIKKAAAKAGISTGTGKDKVYTGGGKHGGFNKGGLMRKGKK